jgi:photosystem II stability/assembly factor-like uncharacterized protein
MRTAFTTTRLILLIVTAIGCSVFGAGDVQAQRRGGGPANTAVEPPHFEYMGPPSAGRFASVVGVAGDSLTYYAGAASGGVWKTKDGGRTFAPLFDDQPVQAIGTLAVAPSNPSIVWAGTGEAWVIRDADVTGDGIYKSTDAGMTWRNMGLPQSGRIGRIIVHPTNPDIVFACVLGRTTAPQQERGVYRTTDGGTTWTRVLFVDANTGCSGLAMDAKDPNVLIAGTWQVEMHTWAMFSGGAGSGVYISRDGGTKWLRARDPGLPRAPVGKIDVAIAPSNSQRMFALIQTANQGSLWRSDNAGVTWKVVSWDRALIGRAGYYIRIAVNPKNADEVFVTNSSFHISTDGGATFTPARGCGDCHDIWIDPSNPDRWALTDDGSMNITTTHGRGFSNNYLPIGQMYHVATDNQTPYWIYSNRQDDGTMRGPTNRPIQVPNVPSYPGGRAGGAAPGAGQDNGWDEGIGGCESGFTLPDLVDPNIIWATCYGNKVTRYDHRLGSARSVSPGMHTLDSSPDQADYRCHWTAPLAIDPFDHNTVYYGCQVVFRTSNAGQSWSVISPDLSTRDPSRIISSGGIIGDNLGQFYGEVVFAIAPSEVQRGLIWAGTNDGKVWYTTSGGGSWIDVTANITGMPAWGTVRKIEPSHFDAATAYIAVDAHLLDDHTPYIFKTTDMGRTWKRVNGDMPSDHPLSYVMAVAENPNRAGMLFAGTGHAFFYSLDDGAHWTQLRAGLPAAPVSWVTVQKTYHDVVISTYGRGLYVLRDITALEQPDQVAAGAPAQLYAPRPGVRQARNGSVSFLYSLKSAPTDSLRWEITDPEGSVVRRIATAGRAGLNRITWDLRGESPMQPALRALAPDNPHIWDEPRFKDRASRGVFHWGIEGPQRAGILAAPGTYRVTLNVDGTSLSQPFEIIRASSLTSSAEDLALNTATQKRIVGDINQTVEMINQLEIVRKQIEDHAKAAATTPAVRKALKSLDEKAMAVELQLLSRTELNSDDKWFVEKYKAYLNLIWLYGEVGTGAGDVAGGADYRPTDTQMATLASIEKAIAAARADYASFMDRAIADYNASPAGKVAPIQTRVIM